MTVLVIAAHPDDETLGAGGSTARWVREGRDVHWLVLGEGTTSRPGATDATVDEQLDALAAAATELGVASVTRHALADNRFDSVDLLDVVRLIEATVTAVEPSLVITHHGGDVNVDHRVVSAAALVAARPLPDSPVAALWAMEVASSTECAFDSIQPFRPQRFVDITSTLDAKCAALARYATEMRDFPHPRSERAVRSLAQWRGATVGRGAAEAFEVVWQRDELS